ncbi:MAG: AMP-binding protein [Actinomycetota bacterium]|nr:AMP-binding protein [Actinomycetota bacterium]
MDASPDRDETATEWSYSRRLSELAAAEPDRPALVVAGGPELTRAQLDRRANQVARLLADLGVGEGDLVTIAYPNGVDFVATTIACWRLGAVPQPVSSRLPDLELAAIVELAQPKVVAGVAEGRVVGVAQLPERLADDLGTDDGPLPDAVSPAWKAPTSGGSTGRPKLIVSGAPSIWRLGEGDGLGYRDGGCLVMPGPLYHNGPFVWSFRALLTGATVVLDTRFDAARTLELIERHRGEVVYLVPTMMHRIWRLDPAEREAYDVSSLTTVWHLAAPCPAWLKEAWIDWLGPEVIMELYGGTEGQAATTIRGDEWLAHRGSVGRPIFGEIVIVDPEGNEVPRREVGEVAMRIGGGAPATYRYIGAEIRRVRDDWESLGDMGWMDEDGYLYLEDRQSDMILSGGANIYPAEVEAAIEGVDGVMSSCVIGLPDDELGNRVHAIVQAAPGTDEDALREALIAHLAERLVRYKIPRTFELVDHPLRDDAGKVRRSALRAERIAAATA